MCIYDKSKVFVEPITKKIIIKIIEEKSYFVEYQPLISTRTGAVKGYGALARFRYKNFTVPPSKVFLESHKDIDLFNTLEYEVKKIQFNNRIDDKTLFVNFDPHLFFYQKQCEYFFSLFKEQKNFVIELVENSYNIVNSTKIVDLFHKYGYQFALDGMFKENSMISMHLLNYSHYVKLDKDILYELRNNSFFYHIVDGIIKFAHNMNKEVVLEGVETQEDLDIAKRRGIDLVQGYYYKEEFIQR